MPPLLHCSDWSCSEEACTAVLWCFHTVQYSEQFLCSTNRSNYHTCQQPPSSDSWVSLCSLHVQQCSRFRGWSPTSLQLLIFQTCEIPERDTKNPEEESPPTHVVSSVCFYIWSHVFAPTLCAFVHVHEHNCLLNNIHFPLFIHINDMYETKSLLNYNHTEIQHDTIVASTESSLKKTLLPPSSAHGLLLLVIMTYCIL